jgi:hypothetical protein
MFGSAMLLLLIYSKMELNAFRFAVETTEMTMIPLDTSVDTEYIGSQTKLSQGDIQTLSKSYSCAGRVATYGGGNAQVRSLLSLYSPFLHLVSSSEYFHFFISGFWLHMCTCALCTPVFLGSETCNCCSSLNNLKKLRLVQDYE